MNLTWSRITSACQSDVKGWRPSRASMSLSELILASWAPRHLSTVSWSPPNATGNNCFAALFPGTYFCSISTISTISSCLFSLFGITPRGTWERTIWYCHTYCQATTKFGVMSWVVMGHNSMGLVCRAKLTTGDRCQSSYVLFQAVYWHLPVSILLIHTYTVVACAIIIVMIMKKWSLWYRSCIDSQNEWGILRLVCIIYF